MACNSALAEPSPERQKSDDADEDDERKAAAEDDWIDEVERERIQAPSPAFLCRQYGGICEVLREARAALAGGAD